MSIRTLLIAAALGLACLAPKARANDAAQVQVRHAWIRVLPGALPHAGYATLVNQGDHAVKLVSARSAAYGKVMLHRSVESNGMSHMHAVPDLPLPAHGKVTLAPGGYHLMLMHAVHPVKPGHTITVTLQFADGSSLDAHFTARPATATSAGD
jgi:copper(I)-binding protein